MAGNSAVITNLAVFKGTDVTVEDTIYQSDGVTPADVSNWDMAFTVHAYNDPTTVFFTKTTGGGGILAINATVGDVGIDIDAADTNSMFVGEYSWVVERTDPGNDAVLSYGLFTVLAK